MPRFVPPPTAVPHPGDVCDAPPDADTCAQCCVDAYPAALQTFDGAFSDCGCFGAEMCYGECSIVGSLCGPGGPPAGQCLECAQTATGAGGACSNDATFQAQCLDDPDCAAFTACVEAC